MRISQISTNQNIARESGYRLMAVSLGLLLFLGGELLAAPRIEDLLEQCMIEAQRRGHDITSDTVVNRISDAVMNRNKKALRKYCPRTLQKARK